ncbi:DEAD/DEAH box helicase [Cellulomonas terrae]|uniref:Helicase ATP-binding domain-containing protein n=1 Tax=Cellulomonas terrae TaxID=311234 RepID=A0A511JLN0_9CELL|nr:helicase-related protein [Cellulomonas terrae]GEL98907.1 hypothetical protein CTE05_24540 [Cellulomonas terrae]
MSTPNDVLHAALCARPLQTASELTLTVADAGHDALTTAEVEELLVGDPRLRADNSTPPRWRALGAGHPATMLNLPTPRRQVLAPAASFGERPGPTVLEQADTRLGILPAAAFAGRPSVRLQEARATTPTTPTVPVRVPVSARLAAVAKPAPETPAAEQPVVEQPPVEQPPVEQPPVETTVEPTVVQPFEPETSATTTTHPTARVGEPLPVRVAPEDRPPAEPFAIAPATPAGGLFLALGATPAVERGPLPPGGEVRYVGPQLRRWQKDVLDAWLAEERRGIIEAVSAQGRAVVGVLAAWDALTRGEKVLVLVPTSDLLDRWFSTLELYLPGLSIGRRDITTAHTFDECDVLVSLVSAAFGQQLLTDGQAGLVIADEVHKYGSARPAETLRAGFAARLGLTSAMERQDPGFDDILRPYFGAVLDGCDLRRGRKDDVLAPFRLAFVAVDLDADEQAEHDALSAQITELAGRLAEQGCTPHRFVEDAVRLQNGWRENARAAADASAYLRAVSTRRDLLATSSAKLAAVATLGPTLARSTHALVFTHTKDAADAAAAGLRTAGVPAAWLHNGLEPEVRRNTLRDLRAGRLRVLTAPKVLDEGLDLPTVDAVVLLAASRSYRQLVQRVGAVLPPTEADRHPVVLVVHARGTVDADDGFVTDLASVATEVRTFDVGTPAAAIAAWFVGA